ncbi:MAG: hypothetical protein QHI48_07930 [Bacteroidota bacterium]|nr:hypothetical protein [Bacteroidota bacterium]
MSFSKNTGFLAAVYLLSAVVCAQVPPLNALGYEASLVFSLLCAAAGGPYVITIARGVESLSGKERTSGVVRAVVRATIGLWAALLVPFAVLVVRAALFPQCSLFRGSAVFFLLPVMTAPFVAALAIFSSTLFRGAGAFIAYFTAVVIFLFHPVFLIVRNPQLFAYNHLFGWFAGFSWDESGPPLRTLALYRISTLAYAGFFVCISRMIVPAGRSVVRRGRSRVPHAVCLAVALLFIAAAEWFGGELGFSTTRSYARSVLGSVYRTIHFEIVYDGTVVSPAEIEAMAWEHEFRLAQVTGELGVQVPGIITSWLYPDHALKRRLLGTETTQIARPWAREIHLSCDSWKHALKHELVHVVAAGFGPAPFRAPVLRYYGMTEGLAMAVERYEGENSLHEIAAGMLRKGLLPPIGAFMKTSGFLSGSPSAMYMASGSFCRWFLDTLGLDAFKRAYRADDIESVTGMSLEELERRWHDFLRRDPGGEPADAIVRRLFARRSVLARVCARDVTERNRAAATALAQGAYGKAARFFRQSDRVSPNPMAAFGYAEALYRMGDYGAVRRYCSEMLSDTARSAALFSLLVLEGDAAFRGGDSAHADSCYSRVIEIRYGGITEGEARRRLDALRSPRVREFLFHVFDRRRAMGNRDSLRRADLADLIAAFRADSGNSTVRFLLGSLWGTSSPARAAEILAGAIPLRMNSAACYLLAAEILYRAGEIENAERLWGLALRFAERRAEKWEAEDGLNRCVWRRSHEAARP